MMNFNDFISMSKMMYQNTEDPVALCDDELSVVWANENAVKRFPSISLHNGLLELINNYKIDDILKSLKEGRSFMVAKAAEPLNQVSLKIVPIIQEEKFLGCHVFFINNAKSIDPISEISSEKIIAGFTNEYKMPLTIIFSTLGLMARHLEETGDLMSKSYANLITQNCYKLLRLSNNLMEVSRYRSGIAKLNLMQGDLTAFIHGFGEAAAMLTNSVDITLKTEVPDEPILTVFDPEKITLVLCNLLSNSCKYTAPDNVIYLKLSKRGEEAVITVSDKGEGIKNEIIDKIFEPYFSYDSNIGIQGAGLGLSIVKFIVTHHGGTIALRSNVGEGTRVAFTLPIKVDDTLPTYTSQKGIKYITDRFSPLFVQMSDICGCPLP